MENDTTRSGRIAWGRGHVRHARIPDWVLDADVSDRAVRLYAVLGRYADEGGSARVSKSKLMKRLRCARSTIDTAMRDLTALGALDVIPHDREDGSGQAANEYLLHWAPPVYPRVTPTEEPEGPPTEEPVPIYEDKPLDREGLGSDDPNPRLTQIAERDLALDVLARECGIAAGSPRAELCAVALYGKGRQRGIRSMFFQEIEAGLDPETRTVTAAFGSEDYERDLAAAIKRKAAAYRARLPGAECSPTALAKWWLDLAVPSPGTRRMIDCPEDGCSSVARSELDLSEHLETWHDYSEATARSAAAKAAA